jgi:hypothetical protein
VGSGIYSRCICEPPNRKAHLTQAGDAVLAPQAERGNPGVLSRSIRILPTFHSGKYARDLLQKSLAAYSPAPHILV